MPSGFSSGDVLIPLADEYDPMFPNDYEKVVKRHREERQRQREQERQKEIEEREKYNNGCLFFFGHGLIGPCTSVVTSVVKCCIMLRHNIMQLSLHA